MADRNLLVGYDSSDDACVYRVTGDTAVIQTVDFFTPIVDDPYLFGQIAAADALSDVYAMGGVPRLAMNLLCVPNCLSLQTVRKILEGGHDKAVEAAGARVRIVGDADETLPFMLEDGITEATAAVLYCPASIYRRGSLPLKEVVRIAHARGIPVIVDAAAQLPPRRDDTGLRAGA